MNKVTRSDKRRIMFCAWQMVKDCGMTIADALRKAWQSVKLRAAMVAGVVRFTYRKTDGTIRHALGTLSGEIVPTTSGKSKANDAIQTYNDAECGAWRSFRVANLIDVAQ